jgi:hypothetical protein
MERPYRRGVLMGGVRAPSAGRGAELRSKLVSVAIVGVSILIAALVLMGRV